MAVGEASFDFYPVPGVRLAAVAAGIRKSFEGSHESKAHDLVLLEFAENSTTVGVFTKNLFAAAPVQIGKAHLKQRDARYFLINSGNANAATGEEGNQDALRCCEAMAEVSGVSYAEILPFSTGVIGERLPTEKIIRSLSELFGGLDPSKWLLAAKGIMTTDTRPKIASRRFNVCGTTVTITGIAKGAGMVQPNMATMLAYITSDVICTKDLLQDILVRAVNCSFNRITVDSDTSTNDSCMLTATGKTSVDLGDPVAQELFLLELNSLMQELAQGIIRDAEGATKFVTINVEGAPNRQVCLDVAYAIANSPLMKTAIFAGDANWGRIVMAIGKADIDIDVSRVDVYLGDVSLMRGGAKASNYREVDGADVMAEEEIVIRVNLNSGDFSDTVWTSDLSHEYVKINAEYRT